MRQIYAAYSGDNTDYPELARVLKASAERHNPDWRVTVEHTYKGVQSRYEGFRRKALDWWRAVCAADDGDEIVLLDCDTLVRGSLDAVFDGGPFDLAVTVRQGARFPISSGVIFVRKIAETQLFFERWMRRTAKLYHTNKRFCDQIALRDLLAEQHDLDVLELPCSVWNCEQHSWSQYDHDETRIAHITSHIRRHLFKGEPIAQGSEPIVAAWRVAEANRLPPDAVEAPDTEPPSSDRIFDVEGAIGPSSGDASDGAADGEPWVPWLQRDEGTD